MKQIALNMDRPRRTTRQSTKSYKLSVASEPVPRVAKRKADPEQRLNTLLESSKSGLASMELPVRISLALRVSTWICFSMQPCANHRCLADVFLRT